MEATLLGLSDGVLDPERHRASFLTNKVGGQPDWMLPDTSQQVPRCARCGAPLAHVLQVYCPVQISPPHHRTLHLFACTGTGCSSSTETWRVIRSQRPEERGTPGRTAPTLEAPPAASEWCDTAEDWGEEEEEEEGGRRKESQVQEEEAAPKEEAGEISVSWRLQGLNLGDAPEVEVPVLRSFFISVVDEAELCGEEDELHHAQQLLREYERREGVSVGEMEEMEDGGDGGKEKYEKTKARHGDAVFSRFMKKISLCPQQILRYSRRGKPLFISEPPADMAVPRCGSCGGGRTFEMQLMPALVSLLRGRRRREGGSEEEEVEVEFGTVLVFTCTNSCWTEAAGSAVEEICFVQPDPDQKLFR
ncbi:programmed cell death protein 2-like isoform X2 [Eleginops maclovinus]|uniref:programmed cell death protein 2-like isoform X2 n=1 Tax=Eleginops maclovinus TaxID=56733 RepID=UPI00308019F6